MRYPYNLLANARAAKAATDTAYFDGYFDWIELAAQSLTRWLDSTKIKGNRRARKLARKWLAFWAIGCRWSMLNRIAQPSSPLHLAIQVDRRLRGVV